MKSRRSSSLSLNRNRRSAVAALGTVALTAGAMFSPLTGSAATQFWNSATAVGDWDVATTANWTGGTTWTNGNVANFTGSNKTIEIVGSIQVSGITVSAVASFNDTDVSGDSITFIGTTRFINSPETFNPGNPLGNQFNDGNTLSFNLPIFSDGTSALTVNSVVNPDATLNGEQSKPGEIILNADNTGVLGDVIVNAGTLTLGTNGRLNNVSSVEVKANITPTLTTVLNLTARESIADTATLTNAGVVNLNGSDADATTDDETVASLVNSGTINGNGVGNTLVAATYALNDGSIINANLGNGIVTANGTVALNGTVGHTAAGNASVINVNSGTTTLANTAFSGDVNVDAGTLTLTAAPAAGLTEAITVDITNDGTINTGASEQIADTADVSVDGTLHLHTFTETVAGVTLVGGTIDADTVGAATLTGTSFAVESGTVNAILSGAAIDLTKSTGGTVTLNAQNTYTGDTFVNAGTLVLGDATNTLDNATDVVVNGGELALGANTDTVNGVSLQSGSITGTGSATEGVLTSLTDFDVRSGSASANLAGAVGLTKTTVGTVTLTGQNAYTGTTTVSDGTLEVTGSGTIAASNVIDIATGATLSTDGGALSQDAIVTSAGTGTLALTGSETIKGLNGTGQVNLDAATLTVDTDGNGGAAVDSAYDGVIADATGVGTLTKDGAGSFFLTGANTYTGVTTVNGGTLSIVSGSLSSTDIQVNNAGNFTTDGGLTDAAQVTLNTVASVLRVVGNEQIDRVTGTGTVRISDAGDDGAGNDGFTLAISSSTDSTFDGVIVDDNATSAGNLTKSGSNKLTLAGANTYTGTTSVTAGTLALEGTSGSLILNISSGATLTTNPGDLLANTADMTNDGTVEIGGDDLIGTYTGSGTLDGTGNTLTATTYTLNTGSEINANIGTGAVTVNGDTTLNGASDASTVDILGGTLTTGSDEYRFNTSVAITVTSPGILALGGNEQAGNIGGTGDVQLGSFGLELYSLNTKTLSGVISGDDSSYFEVYNGGTQTISGANTYTGDTSVFGGSTLILGGTNQSAYYYVSGTSILTANGADRISNTAEVEVDGTYNVQGNDTIGSLSGFGSVVLGGNTLTFNGNGDGTADEELATFDGVISGAGGQIVKTGDDIQVLSGANTYTGDTEINAGTLRITNSAALGGGAGTTTVFSTGTLQLSNGISISESLDLAGAGQAVNYTGNDSDLTNRGALNNLSGINTVTNQINIGNAAGTATTIAADAGTLNLTGDILGNGGTPTLTFQAAEGASIVVTGSTPAIMLGAGIKDLTKTGRGTLDLSDVAGNASTGDLYLNDGRVIVDAQTDLGGSKVIFGSTDRGTLVVENNAFVSQYTYAVGASSGAWEDFKSTQFDFSNFGTIETNKNVAIKYSNILPFGLGAGKMIKEGSGDLLIDLDFINSVLPTIQANLGDIYFEDLPVTIAVNGLDGDGTLANGDLQLVSTNLIVNQAVNTNPVEYTGNITTTGDIEINVINGAETFELSGNLTFGELAVVSASTNPVTFSGSLISSGDITVTADSDANPDNNTLTLRTPGSLSFPLTNAVPYTFPNPDVAEVIFSGDNPGFTGVFTVTGGDGLVHVIQAPGDTTLGSSLASDNTVIQEGGALELSSGNVAQTTTFNERFTMSGGSRLLLNDPVIVAGTTTVLMGTGDIADIGSVSAAQVTADIFTGNIITIEGASVGFNTQPGQVGELQLSGRLLGFGEVQIGGIGNGAVIIDGGSTNVLNGSTVLNDGANVVVGKNTAFGTSFVTIDSDATINTIGSRTLANGIDISVGTLTIGDTSLTTLADNADADPTNDTANNDLRLTGTIQGFGGLTKGDGTGTLVLAGNSTFVGDLTINGGTVDLTTGSLLTPAVVINANGTLITGGGLSSNVDVTTAANSDFNLVGNETVASIGGGGDINLSSKTLTVDNATGGDVSGVITGTGGVTLTAGIQTLSGANTYTGTTTVNGGGLILSAASASASLDINAGSITLNGASGATQVDVAFGSTLTTGGVDILSDSAALINAGTMTFGGDDAVASLTNRGTLAGPGTLTSTAGYALNGGSIVNVNLGDGQITTNGTVALNGNSGNGPLSVITGTTTVAGTSAATVVSVSNGATLATSASDLIADGATVTLSSSGTLTLGGSETFAGLAGQGVVNAGDLTVTTLNGSGSIASTGTVTATSGTFAGNINSGALTKSNAGTLALTGSNTFTGALTVNSGTLDLTTGTVATNTVVIGAAGTLTTGGGLSVNASVTSAGILDLAGAETIASITGAGAVTLNDKTLTIANAAGGDVSGVVSGTGGVTLTAGTQTLSGANTYTGTTTVNGGALTLSGASASLTLDVNGGTLNVNSTSDATSADISTGATLTVGAGGDLTNSIVIGNAGTFTLNSAQTIGTITGAGAVGLNANTLTIGAGSGVASGVFSGTGGITLNAGEITLSGANTYTGATTVTAGTLTFTNASASATIAVNGGVFNTSGDLAANAAVTVAGGAIANFNVSDTFGSLANNGTVNVNGAGTILNVNTYTQTNGILAGAGKIVASSYDLSQISVSADTTLGAGTLNINGNTLLNGTSLANTVNVATATTLTTGSAERLSDASTVTLTGTGALLLGGAETIDTLAGAGTVNSASNFTVTNLNGSSTITLTGPSTLTASAGAFAGVLADGALTKVSTGTLTLTGTSTSTDALNVNAGTLAVNGANASTVIGVAAGATVTTNGADHFANTAALTNAGTVTLGGDDTIGSLVNSGTVSGAFTLTAATYALNNGSNVSANLGAGVITTSGTVSVTGNTGAGTVNVSDGTTTLAGTTAATSVNVNGGTLSVTGTINSATSVFIDGDATLITSGSAKIGDNAIITNAGLLTIGGDETVDSITGSGDIVLGSNILTIDNAASGSNISGTIQGLGSVQLTGGSLTLTGSNTYTGGTLVTGGATLVLAHDGNTLSNVGTFTVGQGISTGNVVLNTNTDTVGPVVLVTGTITGSSDIGAFGYGNQGVLTATGANYQVQLGSISASLAGFVGLDKVDNVSTGGADTVTLSGVNTYIGDTTITSGTLVLGHATSTLADDNDVTINGSTAVLALLGNTDSVGTVVLVDGSITGTGNGTAGVLTATEANFDVRNGTVTATLAGNFGLDKTTAGTVTLNNTQTYIGDTTVQAGTLTVNGSLSDVTDVSVSSGATLNYNASDTFATLTNSGAVNLANNVVLTVGTVTQTAGTLGAAVNTGDSIVASIYNLNGGTVHTDLGAGTVNVGGNTTLNGSSLASTININAGTLTLGSGQRLLDTVAVNFDTANTGGLILGGNETIGSLAGGTSVDSVNMAGFTMTLGGNGDATVDSTSFAGVISNGTLTKTGIDTQVLSGANTYTGTTTVSAGTLTLDGTSQSATLVVNGGNLNVNASSAATTASVSSGSLTTNNGSLLDSIDVTITGGTFAVTGGNETIDALSGTGGSVSIASDTTLSVGSDNGSASYSGVITGFGGLTKIGAGTETLSGANTYTGATLVSAGTLTVDGSLAQTDITVASPATLNYNASDTVSSLTNSGAVNLGAGVVLSVTTLNQNAGTLGALVAGDSITATDYNLNGGTVQTDLNAGTVNVGGSTTLNGNSLAATVNINTGTLTLGSGDRLLDTAAVSFDTTTTGGLTLGGAETIGSLAGGNSADSLTLGAFALTIGGNGNGTAETTSFGGVIKGTGSVIKSGLDTQVLTGTSTYTGTTTVTGGILKVDGSIASSATTVATGAKLMGSGTVGALTVASGATLAPGSSPGTLTVSGNWSQSGTYQAELASASSFDQVVVSGTTALNAGSTLALTKLSGFEATLGQPFQIIDSTGVISGQFATVTSDFTTGLLFDLSDGTLYGTGLTGVGASKQVDLTQLAGLNSNSQAIVSAVQADALVGDPANGVQFKSSTSSGAVLKALLTSGSPATTANQLSPETYAGDTNYAIRVSRNYASTARSLDPVLKTAKFSLFAGYSSYSSGTESSLNQADYDLTSSGALVGASVAVGSKTTVGVFGAFDNGDIKSTFRNGNTDGQVYGVFGDYVVNDKNNFKLSASLTSGSFATDSTRTTALGTATARSVDSDAMGGSIGASYTAIKTKQYAVSPYASVNYTKGSTNGFTETGSADALTVRDIDYTSVEGEIGARGYYLFTRTFAFTGGLGISQEFGDRNTDVTGGFDTTSYTVRSGGVGSTALSGSIGFSAALTRVLTLDAGYKGSVVNDGKTASSVFIGGSMKF